MIRINRKDPLPIYVQIKQQIKTKIEDGQLNPFDNVPSIPEMTRICGVSAMTVRHAYTELVNEGLLFFEHGKGTFVADFRNKPPDKEDAASKTLGLVLPDIVSDVYPKITKGVEDTAHDKGYSVVICNTEDKTEKQVEYLQRMREQKVSGLIITPIAHKPESIDHYQQLQRDNIPFVFINRFIPQIKDDSVISDNTLGGYLATKHLIDQGHRRIAYISDPYYIVTDQRLAGYKKALAEANIDFDESLVRFAESDNKNPGYTYMKELMLLNNPPAALFAFNDRIASEAYEAIVEAGLKVPDDVAIVGYDDSTIAISLPVPLTTVAYPSYATGKLAAEVLLDKIDMKHSVVHEHVLAPKLVVRQSCGAEASK